MKTAPLTLAATAALALALPLVACDTPGSPSGEAPNLPRSACRLALISSDFLSSTLSLLTEDGQPCAPDFIDSGAQPPGLHTAFSGDLALPSSPNPAGTLVVIDRYPTGVLTEIDVDEDQVLRQLRVSPDFASNPQDIAFLPNWIVSRLERSPHEEVGSDLFQPEHAPIPLIAHADPGFDPMPTQFAATPDTLWLLLNHLKRDFTGAGPGRLLQLDTQTGAPIDSVDLSPFENCTNLSVSPDHDRLWISCSGLFHPQSTRAQIEGAGLISLPLQTEAPPTLIPATSLPDEKRRPFGRPLAALDDDRALAVIIGDLADQKPDRLVLVDGQGGTQTLLTASAPFTFEDLYVDRDNDLILLLDANPQKPQIHRFHWPTPDALPQAGTPLPISPSGLAPRQLRRFR